MKINELQGKLCLNIRGFHSLDHEHKSTVMRAIYDSISFQSIACLTDQNAILKSLGKQHGSDQKVTYTFAYSLADQTMIAKQQDAVVLYGTSLGNKIR